jgi:hypothetical protein
MRAGIEACALPESALLARYQKPGHYTDAYALSCQSVVPLARFVEAFYTSRVFKLERLILRLALGKPATDAEAGQLARGEIAAFAAWTVEDRNATQLLLCDVFSRTRSWFMVQPLAGGGTRLTFGSAVMPTPRSVRAGALQLAWSVRALVGLHRLYSRVLLRAACAQLPVG